MGKVNAQDELANELANALANVPGLTPAVAGQAALEPVSLDDVDLAILDLLVRDARASQRRIAREVGMSPPAVAERIGRLERAGVIRGYRAELDRARLGFSMVVYVSVIAVNTLKHPDEMLTALRALPEVEDVSIVAGPMDLMLRLRVRDHEHLRQCLFDKIWKLPGVNRTETFLSLSATDTKPIDLDLIRMLRSS
jgi:DNA-binding Lrp family transcriptional regulator